MTAHVRPLSVRPGARFACAGDGLCCTDVHLLGPVAKAERAPIEAVRPNSIVRGRHLAVLAPTERGHCTFLSDEMRCGIHAPELQPRSCARYPFLLAATPAGGRIGTDHRCPCRTMGERPPLRVEDALPSLLDRRGRLSADRRIDGRIAIDRKRRVSFARYEALEAERLGSAGVLAGEGPDGGRSPRAGGPAAASRWIQEARPLGGKRWRALAARLDVVADTLTRWGAMHAAFARGLEALVERRECVPFARPWAESFARAERRSPTARDPEEMLADWAADVIWALEWTFAMSLAETEIELAWRAEIARTIARSLPSRADAAMAEAIAIVEVAGLSDEWISFVLE